jgi:hypothetical protein
MVKLVLALGAAAVVSACAAPDMASRGVSAMSGVTLATQGRSDDVASPVRQILAPRYDVADVRITVPRSLKVSEANVYYPLADIVWRGEPRGDRHAQVAAIFQEAMAMGTAGMERGPRVIVDIEVTRFHSVTEKTRYTVGGTHSLHFRLTVRDAATGAVIEGPRPVIADTRASGGAQAIAEDQMGRTQRIVILDRLAQVIRRELSGPADPALVPDPRLMSQLQEDVVVTLSSAGR